MKYKVTMARFPLTRDSEVNKTEIPGSRTEGRVDTGVELNPIWLGYLEIARRQKEKPEADYGKFKVWKTEADPEADRLWEALDLFNLFMIEGGVMATTVVRVVKVELDQD